MITADWPLRGGRGKKIQKYKKIKRQKNNSPVYHTPLSHHSTVYHSPLSHHSTVYLSIVVAKKSELSKYQIV